jgi:hypothetical protein
MRLTIIAGLMVGVSLAIQSAHAVRIKGAVNQAPSAAGIHASAPWYFATDAGRSPKKLANT